MQLVSPHDPALLGRNVRAVLNRGHGDGGHEGDPVIARGQLLSFSAMGEVILLGEDGDVHWCWPGLEVLPDD